MASYRYYLDLAINARQAVRELQPRGVIEPVAKGDHRLVLCNQFSLWIDTFRVKCSQANRQTGAVLSHLRPLSSRQTAPDISNPATTTTPHCAGRSVATPAATDQPCGEGTPVETPVSWGD